MESRVPRPGDSNPHTSISLKNVGFDFLFDIFFVVVPKGITAALHELGSVRRNMNFWTLHLKPNSITEKYQNMFQLLFSMPSSHQCQWA
jgi:hypothetical protein